MASSNTRRFAPWTGALALMAVLLWSGAVWASTPERVAQERTEAVAQIMSEPDSPDRTTRLAATIDESIDFAHLAERALGEHWQVRTEEEREEFLTLLRRLLQANYEDRLGGQTLGEDYVVEYGEARIRRDRAFVRAEVTHRNRTEEVVYRLYNDGGEWRIYDLVIDDISLEETYREGYVPIIEEDGWEELIGLMRDRVAELDAE